MPARTERRDRTTPFRHALAARIGTIVRTRRALGRPRSSLLVARCPASLVDARAGFRARLSSFRGATRTSLEAVAGSRLVAAAGWGPRGGLGPRGGSAFPGGACPGLHEDGGAWRRVGLFPSPGLAVGDVC